MVSSTQIPFHVRRIVGNALDIPSSKVRVIKPRIGGGFGAKQTSVSEIYPGTCHMDDRASVKDHFFPIRIHDLRLLRVMRWKSMYVAGADENGIVKRD